LRSGDSPPRPLDAGGAVGLNGRRPRAAGPPGSGRCHAPPAPHTRSPTMRKLLLSVVALLLMTGLVVAGEVVFVSYKDKKLTVKDGDAEKVYTVTDKTAVKVIDKDGNAKAGELKILEKLREGKSKIDITTDKDTVTEIKIKRGKKQ
jgi:hypothetical protein